MTGWSGGEETPHAHVEAALESIYEDLAYITVGTVGYRDRRGPSRLSLGDIYVALRSDVSVDLSVRDYEPTVVALRQASLQVGLIEGDAEVRRSHRHSENVDQEFLDLMFARTVDLIRTGALLGLRVAVRPLIAAPLWADGDKVDVAALEAASAVNLYRHSVLLGPPGSGKSTLAKMLALSHLRPLTQLAGGGPETLGLWRSLPLVPIFIELRNLATYAGFPPVDRAATVEQLLDYIRDVICRSDVALFEYLRSELHRGRAYLILDGLDEVPIPHDVPDALELRREQITGLVVSVARRFPNLKLLVTSRPAGYSGWTLPGFDVLHLLPLSPSETRALVHSLYRGMGHPEEWCVARTALLEKQLPAIPESLRAQPLFVSLLALLFESSDVELPRQRGALLSEAIDLLLGAWSLPRTGEVALLDVLGCTGEQLLERLEVIALRSLESGATAPDEPTIPRALILDELYELGSHVNPAGALEYVSQHAGILVSPTPRRYRFAHRLFQEYLAASAISKGESPSAQIIGFLRVSIATWREVALLFADVLTNGRRTGDLWEYLSDLVGGGSVALTLMAADIVIDQESLKRSGRIYDSIVPELREAFVSALTDRALSPDERRRVGAALAWVMDDRPGVGVDPEGAPSFDWCDIPSGEAILGTTRESRVPLDVFGTKWSYEREEPQHSIFVEGFEISRYPVTVAQYQVFAADPDGFSSDRWWTSTGLEWKNANPPAPPPAASDLSINLPQGGVTWYEAMAYCSWASEMLTYHVRLPRECEWEWAARGPEGWLYPWGNEPRPDLANTLENGVLRPMSVGSFPNLTPWGVGGPCDLIGNVWEWCSSGVEVDKGPGVPPSAFGYPVDDADGRENVNGGDLVKRATRGGYFGTSQAVSRASLRGRDVPSVRVERQGFRLVRSVART